MHWYIYVLISIFLYTTLNLLQRKLAVNSQHPRAAAALFTSIAGIIAVVYAGISGELSTLTLPHQTTAWIGLGAACLFYGLFERGRFLAAKWLEASVFNTLINASLVVSFLASIILFHEDISVNRLTGTLLIILGLLIISFEQNIKKLLNKKTLFGLVIGATLGLAWTADKHASAYFNANIYNIFVWTLPVLVIVFPSQKISHIKTEWSLGSWKIILLAALNVFGYIAQIKAIQETDLSQVMPLIQTSVIFTVILSAIFLKERDRFIQKLVAAIIASIGIFLLV